VLLCRPRYRLPEPLVIPTWKTWVVSKDTNPTQRIKYPFETTVCPLTTARPCDATPASPAFLQQGQQLGEEYGVIKSTQSKTSKDAKARGEAKLAIPRHSLVRMSMNQKERAARPKTFAPWTSRFLNAPGDSVRRGEHTTTRQYVILHACISKTLFMSTPALRTILIAFVCLVSTSSLN